MNKSMLKAVITLLIAATCITFSCKKDGNRDKSGGCSISGLDATVTTVFYVSKDYGGGQYVVQVKDANGNNVLMNQNILKVYDATPPPTPCNDPSFDKRANVYLSYGKKYTWTAKSDNRSYQGTIDIPCDGSLHCKLIQIDQNYQ